MAYLTDKEPTGLTAKTTPVDADVVIIGDSADASEVAKKTTWANVKATLKTYNDTLYAAVLGADDNYVTDAEKTKLSNLSGTNTGDQTNITGNAATVTTNANLTGHVTSVGNAAVLGSFTKAQLDTAVSDGNILYVGDVTSNATHTGDATGATALTLATVNSNVGSFTNANVTVNAKGLITAASSGTGLSDGDKGDITVSASGATWTIDNGAVSLAKQADMATASVVYRKTAGSGAPEVQTLTTLKTDLGLSNTNSGDQTTIAGITGTKAQFDTAVTDGNFMYIGDAPTSHTHALSEITDSTSEALGVGSLEVGHASDTTISRSAAGVIAVEGVVIPSISSTNTLTNKRVTKRVTTTNAPGATPTTNTDNVDVMNFTGLATAITSMTTNLSGTPVDGDLIMFRFTDDGTARAITWGASFAATTVALPTTTVISTMLRVGFQYSGSTWKCIAVA